MVCNMFSLIVDKWFYLVLSYLLSVIVRVLFGSCSCSMDPSGYRSTTERLVYIYCDGSASVLCCVEKCLVLTQIKLRTEHSLVIHCHHPRPLVHELEPRAFSFFFSHQPARLVNNHIKKFSRQHSESLSARAASSEVLGDLNQRTAYPLLLLRWDIARRRSSLLQRRVYKEEDKHLAMPRLGLVPELKRLDLMLVQVWKRYATALMGIHRSKQLI